MKDDIQSIKEKLLPILKDYDVRRAGLFGSCVTGDMNKESDVDILVDIKKDISLFEFVRLKQRIEKKLSRKVDLVEYDTIKPLLKDKLMQQQVIII